MIDTPHVRQLIRLALEEDLGSGDITARLTIPETHRSSAKVIARQNLILCGVALVRMIVEEMKSSIVVNNCAVDGARLAAGDLICELSGFTRELLCAERTILNFLQRLCGVASHTADFVRLAQGITVLDTRKTTPGWRILEKYGVSIGGGTNHRGSLSDMVLIKNNHIDAAGMSVEKLVREVKNRKPPYLKLEVEVRSIDELTSALKAQPDVVMLDNMSDELIKEALTLVDACSIKPLVEVSGGITKERLQNLAALGVKMVSAGSLTSQATCVDISMRIVNK